MPKIIEFNTSFSYSDLAGTGPATPASLFTATYTAQEANVYNVNIGEGASSQNIDFGLVDQARYFAIKSNDVLFEVEIDGNTAGVGRWWSAVDTEIRSMRLSNLGTLFDQGVATSGSATTITDTSKSWIYSTLDGRVKPIRSMFFARSTGNTITNGMVDFVLSVDGCIALISVYTAGFHARANEIDSNAREALRDSNANAQDIENQRISDILGLKDDLIEAIQEAINNAPGIGSGHITVSWVADQDDNTKGNIRFTANNAGEVSISVSAHQDDTRSMNTFGLDFPVFRLGGDSPNGMNLRIGGGPGSGQQSPITDATGNSITFNTLTTAAATGSEYRILNPSPGNMDILIAR